MIEFLEIYERAVKGPVMKEKDFEMKVFFHALKDVVNKYEIEYDRKEAVQSDDKAADNLYKAAVEFLTRVGIFCTDTNRIIQFNRNEILETVLEAPGKCVMGEGKDAGVYTTRQPDDPTIPWSIVGWGWISPTEEMATNQIEAIVSIKGAKSINIPSLNTIKGLPVAAGSPAELYGAIRTVQIARNALMRAGRPGMPVMNWIPTSSTAVTTLAASAAQFGCRTTDGWLCGNIAEMKIDFEIMNKVAYLLNWGGNIGAESAPILGGYCGGPAGTAVVATAYILVGLISVSYTHLTLPTN